MINPKIRKVLVQIVRRSVRGMTITTAERNLCLWVCLVHPDDYAELYREADCEASRDSRQTVFAKDMTGLI